MICTPFALCLAGSDDPVQMLGALRCRMWFEWELDFDVMANTRSQPPDRLIFIYNADGGIAQGLLDSIHKTLSPATYACSLCALTYGAFTMDRRWRAWLKALPIPAVFYHKDDAPYRNIALPVVLTERGGEIATLIPADRLDVLDSVDALIAEIEQRLALK